MIETFKILKGTYDTKVTEGLLERDSSGRTSGISLKQKKRFSRLNVRKYSFTNRVADAWNGLPDSVVLSTADCQNCQKL